MIWKPVARLVITFSAEVHFKRSEEIFELSHIETLHQYLIPCYGREALPLEYETSNYIRRDENKHLCVNPRDEVLF